MKLRYRYYFYHGPHTSIQNVFYIITLVSAGLLSSIVILNAGFLPTFIILNSVSEMKNVTMMSLIFGFGGFIITHIRREPKP